MSIPKALALTVLLLAVIAASAPANKKSRPVPQKLCGHSARVATPLISGENRGGRSLDDIYTSTNVPVVIPDGPNGDTAVSVLTIPDAVTITDLNVMVTITHTWIRDLRISLVAPNDSEVVLLDLLPQDNAVNMTDTWFDDEAPISIDSGVPPFTGTFRPHDTLSVFDGLSAQGTWTLRVLDRFHLDTGRVENWAIEINRPIVLSGTVVNRTTRLPLPQVKVEALPTGSFTFTNSTGFYGFDQLVPGAYDLRFTKALYESLTVVGVSVIEDQQTIVDTSLFAPVQLYDFASTSPPVSIPDEETALMSLEITEDIRVSDLDVTVNITHTWVGDLSLYLVSPQPDTVQLVFVGSQCLDLGANMIDTRFDDQAALPFSSGTAPFTGSFRPYDSLATFFDVRAAGTWYLVVTDNCSLDVGTIQNFTLHVQVGSLAADDHFIPNPSSLSLSNFPNPFNSSTEFRFALTRSSRVELLIFDVTGRRVGTVINHFMTAGEHSVIFDARNLPSGIYFARLSAAGQSQSHKLLLLR